MQLSPERRKKLSPHRFNSSSSSSPSPVHKSKSPAPISSSTPFVRKNLQTNHGHRFYRSRSRSPSEHSKRPTMVTAERRYRSSPEHSNAERQYRSSYRRSSERSNRPTAERHYRSPEHSNAERHCHYKSPSRSPSRKSSTTKKNGAFYSKEQFPMTEASKYYYLHLFIFFHKNKKDENLNLWEETFIVIVLC